MKPTADFRGACRIFRQHLDAMARACKPSSPFARARAALGARYDRVMKEAIKRRTAVIFDEKRDETLERLCSPGEEGAKAVILAVLGAVVQDAIAAAGVS